VDGRIEHGFRERLRALARFTKAGDAETAAEDVERQLREARAEAAARGRPVGVVLAGVWEKALVRAKAAASSGEAARARVDARAAIPPWERFDQEHPPRFLCDPSLGGLARWLRAAGYEASLAPDVPGYRLPDEALHRGLVLLTTEAEVLDRRIVADGSLVAVWVPSALTMAGQLHMVAVELGLSRRRPRCMACGGALVPTPKELVRPRIPPRTALWKDEYFVCAGCDRLFWHGTHWERIETALRRLVAA
jgi:uncharacterized protein with PIN domain